MASEATLRFLLNFTKGAIVNFGKDTGDMSLDVSGSIPINNRQTIGTSAEAVVVGDVGTAGYILYYNAGSTTIHFRNGSGGANVAQVRAGKWGMFEIEAGSTLYAVADTSASDLLYWLIPQ